nr:hypothetical protein [Tanacetum cinerariifolium]
QSCLLHHLWLPTLPSTPILNQGGYFRERTRSCRTEVLRESSFTAILPSPPLPPPLYTPPPVDRRDDVPKTEMPPRNRLGLSTLGSKYKIKESFTARPTGGQGIDYGFVSTVDAEARQQRIGEVGYGIRDTWVDLAEAVPKIAPMTLGEAEIAELQETDRRRLVQMIESLLVMGDIRREMDDMQAKQIMAPMTRQRPNNPPNNTNPNNMTPESVRAMIDQALLQNFTNEDGSHRTKGVVKFVTCTLLDAALTWWNSQIRSLGPDAYSMTWEVLKKKMTEKYRPHGEIKKLENQLSNLKVKGNDVLKYIEHFQELTLICTKFVANETEKIDKYISGLLDNIHGSVKYSKHKTLDDTIELANDFMDQKLRTYAERQTNKRKADDLSRNNHGHQQQPAKRHFKRDCPNLKNKDGGKCKCTRIGVCSWECREERECIEGPRLKCCHGYVPLKNRYASILFNTGADRSFISTAFSSLIDIIPTLLGNSYDVELADGKIVRISAKKEKDKSEGKQLKDVPIVRDFPEVFPEDLPGLPLARPVEF